MHLSTTSHAALTTANSNEPYIPAWPNEGEGEEPPLLSVEVGVEDDKVTISTFDEYTDNMNTTSLSEEEVIGLISRLQQALGQMSTCDHPAA